MVRFWATKYKTQFNDDPTIFSAYGYAIIDAFAQAAQKTGPGLTTDSLIKSLDSMTIPADIFGAPQMSFTATKRLGSDQSRLSQITDGKWKVVSDYARP